MKKFLCFLTTFIFLVLSFSVISFCDEGNTTSADTSNSISLTINGKKIDTVETYGVAVTYKNNTLFFPLRAITDAYEMNYKISEDNREITCISEESTVIFTVDNTSFLKDGSKTAIATPVQIVNNEPIITDDTLTAAFDFITNYKSEKNRATIVKKDPVREADLQEKKEAAKNESKNKGSKKDEILTVISALNTGFFATLKLFFVTLIGAIPLGLIIALCSMSKFLPLKYLTRLFVWIIRGTPLMLQLLIIFYVPGMFLTGGSFWPRGEEGRFMAACVAFIINYAFYFSEIYRGGIENVPKGQVEAGQVLGMTKTQIFFNVTLVQMIKRIVPPMSNEIITLVKDTSIARMISMEEIIWAGYAFLKTSHGYSGLLWPLFFTGVYYLLFNGILTILFGKLEKKLGYFS